MSDYSYSIPNAAPGRCAKCRGTGRAFWGGSVNGKLKGAGTCWACRGAGRQSASDIARNRAYNRHQIQRV